MILTNLSNTIKKIVEENSFYKHFKSLFERINKTKSITILKSPCQSWSFLVLCSTSVNNFEIIMAHWQVILTVFIIDFFINTE